MKCLMVAATFGGTLLAQEPPAPQQAPANPGQSKVEQQAQQAQATDYLKRAYTACMEARNYTVK